MLNKIKNEIDKYDNIILSSHVNPDGDAFGSLFAFKFMIEKYNKNKKVDIVLQYPLPKYIHKFEESIHIKNSFNKDNVELIIMLDTASLERAAIDNEIFKIAKQSINIDHHISNTKYLNINYVENISSTSELLYKFLNVFNIDLDQQIAKFMYLGLINDTGNFRHSNITDLTFEVASKLMKQGINNSEITNILFSKSERKTKVFGDALSNYIYFEKYKLAFYYISKEIAEKFNATEEDCDGVSELLLSIDNVEISLFLRNDLENNIKGSFRSKKIDVNKLASIFNGGGHKLAAGFKTKRTVNEIIELIKEKLNENI